MAYRRSLVLFIILGAIWGGAYPAIKIGLEYIPPVLFAAIRYDVAGILMLGYVVYTSDYWYPRARTDWFNAIIGGVLVIAAYNAFLFVGETSIPSAIAGILVGLMPIFSAIFTRLLTNENMDMYGGIGVVLGFVGVFVISSPDTSNLISENTIGQVFVIAAAASMAFGSVLTDRVDAKQPAVTMETWSMVFGAVFLHIAAFVRPSRTISTVVWTNELILMIAFLAVLSSAVAYFIYFDLLDRLGAFEMNFIAYAAAVFGALYGWLLLDEDLGASTIVGFVIIFFGFVLLKKDGIQQLIIGHTSTQESA